jgi:hypothetical protein
MCSKICVVDSDTTTSNSKCAACVVNNWPDVGACVVNKEGQVKTWAIWTVNAVHISFPESKKMFSIIYKGLEHTNKLILEINIK